MQETRVDSLAGRSPGEGNGNPLQYSCLENPMERGTWRVTVHRVSKTESDMTEHTLLLKQTWWIKMSQIFHLTVLKVRNPKSVYWAKIRVPPSNTPGRAMREPFSLPLSASRCCPHFLACRLFPATVSLWRLLSSYPLWLWPSCLSLIRILLVILDELR